MPKPDHILQRYARSLSESFSYYPDWRARQVKNYKTVRGKLETEGKTFAIPVWENDEDVLRLYAAETEGDTFDAKDLIQIGYANDAIDENSRTGHAARIRSMACAFLEPGEIAQRMGTTEQNISTFLKLYFDIIPSRHNREFMSSIVFPFDVPRGEPAIDRKERGWRCAAFLLGVEGYEQMVHKQISAGDGEIEEMNRRLNALLMGNALDWAIGRRAGMFASQTDLEMIVQTRAALQGDNNDREKGSAFADQLLELVIEQQTAKMSLRDNSLEVSRTTTSTSRTIRSRVSFDFEAELDEPVHYSGGRGRNGLAFLH